MTQKFIIVLFVFQRLLVALFLALFLALLFVEGAHAGPNDKSEISFDISNGPPSIPVEIQGKTYNFLVVPSKWPLIILNKDIAEEYNLKPSGSIKWYYEVDGEKSRMKRDEVRLKIGNLSEKKYKISWIEQNFWPGFDGAIGIAKLKYDRIVFKSDKLVTNKTVKTSFDLKRGKKWGWVTKSKFHEDIEWPVYINFRPHYAQSRFQMVSTVLLKKEKGLKFAESTETIHNIFGVPAVVRQVEFTQPISIWGQSFNSVMAQDVVTKSSTSNEGLGENLDEVIVKGTKKSKAKPYFTVGRDIMEKCAKIVFEPKKKKVHLYCG